MRGVRGELRGFGNREIVKGLGGEGRREKNARACMIEQ